jgi:Zn-dependent protease with chaperone function
MKRKAILSNYVVAAVIGFSTPGAAISGVQIPESNAPMREYDCSNQSDLDVSGVGLKLIFQDGTAEPNKSNLVKLRKLACTSAAAAIRLAVKEGRPAPWINGLPVVLRDDLNGQKDQAYFERTPVRRMAVAAGILTNLSEAQALFIFGHELGHGVYGHAMAKSTARAGLAITSIFVGAGAAVFGKGKLMKVAGVATGLAVGGAAACAPGMLNVGFEKQADAFGLKAMVEAGILKKDAQSEVVALMRAHQEQEPGCFKRPDGSYSAPDDFRHPATGPRIKAIERVFSPG